MTGRAPTVDDDIVLIDRHGVGEHHHSASGADTSMSTSAARQRGGTMDLGSVEEP